MPRRVFAAVMVALARTWRALRGAARFATSAGAIIVLMLLAGSTCAVAGVQLLHGTAWALLTAAVILFVLAGLLLRGIARG
jgi:hypothetical protein